MSIESNINHLRERQEAHIHLTDALIERVEMQTALLQEVVEWMNAPPDTGMGDLIREMTTALHGLQEQVKNQGKMLQEIARARPR